MNWAAFTICHGPALGWFLRNFNRIQKHYDEWFLILGTTEHQYRGCEKYLIGYEEQEYHYEWLHALRGMYPKLRVVELNNVDKLTMCNFAYDMAKRFKMHYLHQIDADEWYTTNDIERLQVDVESWRVPILNVQERKYWKNFMRLEGGIWEGYPARIFGVYDGAEFSDHRPPGIKMSESSQPITQDPKDLTKFKEVVGPRAIMDHFCYVDDYLVQLKAAMFSSLRSNHDTYKHYFEWYDREYAPWIEADRHSEYFYHPAEGPRKMESDPQEEQERLEHRYPEDWHFLRGFIYD